MEMMASLGNFETLGEIGDAQFENLGFENWSQNRRFLSTDEFCEQFKKEPPKEHFYQI